MSNTNAVGSSDAKEVPPILIDMIEPAIPAKRFFFQRGLKDKLVSCEVLQHPVPIKSGGNFEVPITTGGLLPGWYCAVFGVSLAHLEDIEDKLDNIIFDVTSTEMNTGAIRIQDYTCKTVIKKDEIAVLLTLPRPRTESTRLKLHRQIEVRSDFDLTISMRVKTVPGCEENTSLALHYFELACPNTCSEDHALWGDGKPDQFIRTGAAEAALGLNPIVIEACGISTSGKLAVTVYIDPTPTEESEVTDIRNIAHIEVWNLSVPSGQASSGHPEEITKPVASWTVSVPALREIQGDSLENSVFEDPPQTLKPTINISSTGLHLIMAVGCVETAVHAAPFLIYRTEQNPPVQYSYKQVPGICQEIQKSFGFGAFHNIDQNDPNSENERFFNFHGSQFDIYSTTGGWKQLHSLTFGIKGILPTPRDMFYLAESLRGRYFAWTGDRGSVAIWDFETGKRVKTILIPKDKRGVCAALSEDGSMVAITVNGRIRVHHVDSGTKLGVYETKWKEDNGSEIIFRRDYFMALDVARSTSGTKNIDARSIFRVRDMKVVKTHHVFWQYGAMFSSTLNPVFAYKQGAIVNIKRLGNDLSPNEHNDCTPSTACAFDDVSLNLRGDKWTSQNPSSAGITFGLERDILSSGALSIQKLIITNGHNNAALSLGPAQESRHCSGFHVASSSQLVLILNGFLQVWRVPFADGQQYELVHVEAFVAVPKVHANDTCITKVSTVQSCTHGRKFIMKMEPIEWHSDPKKQETEDDPEDDEGEGGQGTEEVKSVSAGEDATDGSSEEQHPDNDQMPWTLTFPRAPGVTFPTTEKYRYENGIVSLLDIYADSDEEIKEAIIRFLADRIRPSSKKNASSLEILCRAWKYNNRATFKMVLVKLLPESGSVTWIPDNDAEKREDPLSILLEIAKNRPVVLDPCKVILNYCVSHAIAYRNISFLSPFLRSLKRIMLHFPGEARSYLLRIAYLPVDDRLRDYIEENSTVILAPWYPSFLWKTRRDLNKSRRLIMQLNTMTKGGPRINNTCMPARPIYVASFEALWHIRDGPLRETQHSDVSSIIKPMWTTRFMVKRWWATFVGYTIQHESMLEAGQRQEATPTGPNGLIHHSGTIPQTTNWWKTAYHILRAHPKFHTYVKCHNFSFEFQDNPAIAALVAYKWYTIGYTYWAVRFFFHCVFYGLVVAAALLQIYHDNVGRLQLAAVAVAIIVMGSLLLWLEGFRLIRKYFERFRREWYNVFDMCTYTLPISGSLMILLALWGDHAFTNPRALSWSVLIVSLHMVFELRVFKSVNQYETFIAESVREMKTFFFIFAGGLVAFTIAILHLLRACQVPGSCEDSKSEFSKQFLGAFSATYFFMGGRFDPVAVEFKSDDWPFHIMMMLYFFFTVIIMLNMLIALINVAFSHSKDGLSLIESRLHYIEMAENLSYAIPGFRQTHNWFPKEIYYCATASEVKEYEEMVRVSNGEAKETLESDAAVKELKVEVQDLRHQLASQQEREERRFQELKDLLVGRAENAKKEIESTQ